MRDPLSPGLIRADARQLDALCRRAARRSEEATDDAPFITATITSPPYGRMVNYGPNDQIGFGQTDDEYLSDCRRLFQTLHRWTRNDGSLWLVVDSYLSPRSGSKVSRLVPLPFVLSAIAEEEGWTLREVIIWQKDRTRPWSHHGKLRNAFEYVLLLVKTKNFKFNVGRLRSYDDLASWWVRYPERYSLDGKTPDNVWTIPLPVQGSWAKKAYQHACPLPVDLVRRLVLLSTDEGDVVADPFGGIGTVPAVAQAMSRRAIATELNADFVGHFRNHVRREVADLVRSAESKSTTGPTAEIIARLRALKFAKALFGKLRQACPELSVPALAIVDIFRGNHGAAAAGQINATWYFAVEGATLEQMNLMQVILKESTRRAPLSKYGVVGDVLIVDQGEARRILADRSWHVYEHGHTWISRRTVKGSDALRIEASSRRGEFLPIVSSHRVAIEPDHVGDAASDNIRRKPTSGKPS